LGALEEFQRRYGKDVAYFVVYFEDAHPEDGLGAPGATAAPI
jgi:hypothetical protein